jgi:acetyl-CoA C-acetyltransferase
MGAVIIAARRTPIGKFGGQLSGIHPAELGGLVTRAVLEVVPVPADAVDEVIFGCARQAGNGPNIARQVVRRAGLSDAVPAFTVNQACASSLKALTLAAQAILAGDAHLVVAGGTESMSRVPFLLDRARSGYRLGHAEAVDAMYRDGFLCPLCGQLMGETAETLADRYAIPREEQDQYAVETQARCRRAIEAGLFRDEIVPVPLDDGGSLAVDEHPRAGVTVDALAKLPPVFRKGGTVHAGNSSGITDGAAALLVASEKRARELGARPLARVAGYATAGVDPAAMGLGPVPAVRRLEEKLGLSVDDYDLVELNEAFASQVLACDRELRFDRARLNVNGGAIALGHPIGATGARIVTTLLHEMRRRRARLGLATLCVSGGLGMAVAFEAVQ